MQARAAFDAAQSERAARGLPQVELDDRYLAALEAGLPSGAGMAMGVDRVVAACLGLPTIGEAMAFAWDDR